MDRQLRRWRVRLAHNNCTPLLAVATPLPRPLRGLQALPTLFVSMDAAKADQHGDILGLGGYCH
eukprot:4724583-Pleurochrysis_carterae.AAC.1